MIKVVLFFSFICFAAACHFQPKQSDCSKLKAGEFYISGAKAGQPYSIVRNDVNQVETNIGTGAVTTLKIKWINPCEYMLTFVSRKTIGPDTMPHLPPNVIIRTLITEVKDDYYIFETKADNLDMFYSDTMRIIKTR
jgi:hypothetical protein